MIDSFNVVDLSHKITDFMPVYPGTERQQGREAIRYCRRLQRPPTHSSSYKCEVFLPCRTAVLQRWPRPQKNPAHHSDGSRWCYRHQHGPRRMPPKAPSTAPNTPQGWLSLTPVSPQASNSGSLQLALYQRTDYLPKAVSSALQSTTLTHR